MALITCKTCGKRISDTAKACVHCGEPLEIEHALSTDCCKKAEENISSEKASDPMVKFQSLGEEQQEELVHAFWKADEIAMNYQKKTLILDHLKYCFMIPLFLLPFISILVILVLRLHYQTPEALLYTISFSVIALVAGRLKVFLFWIVEKLTVKRRERRLAYEKRFHLWAKREKNIDYTPIFIRDTDRLIFEQINVDTIYKL